MAGHGAIISGTCLRFWRLFVSFADSGEGHMTKELEELIDRARKVEMTPDQAAQQRRSFAYGNTHIENERITRELIADVDRKIASDR
jgi:hypothetical protein